MGTGDDVRDARERRLLKAAETYVEQLGESLLTLDDHVEDPRDGASYITEVRLRVRYDDEGDVLVVVKRSGEAGDEIAFHTADRMSEGLKGLANRLRNGSLKWREDKPYDER